MQVGATNMNEFTTNADEQIHGGTTPQYIIQCAKFFSSNIEGYEDDGAPCLYFKHGGARLATYNSSGELSGDGRIIAHDTKVHMKYGSWSPIIYQFMLDGKKVEKISLHRFISVEGTKKIIQTIDYETCLIKTYDQIAEGGNNETIMFSFCYNIVEDTSKAYDEEGTSIGNVGTRFDFAKLKTEVK